VQIVDPDRQFRRLLRLRLQDAGLEVVEAVSHDKALETMLKSPPELVLVDLDSGPPAAFQLLQEMQQDPALARMPIAFLSRRRDRVARLRALRQGVDDFLDKREDVVELVARIENILIREAIRARGESRRNRRGITGDLENLSLAEIIQTLAIGMKTACVSVRSAGREGRIWFEAGAPRHAATGALTGEPAFYEMVRWTAGEFVIEHGQRSRQSSLSKDAIFLLMEGLRLMDESGGAPVTSQAAS